jgi:hypothetical protein
VEVHDEVFTNGPRAAGRPDQARGPLAERLVARINSGLAIDEVIDLWGLIFPGRRNVWYDEEEGRIHYTKDPRTNNLNNYCFACFRGLME